METYLILQRLVSIPSVDNERETQLYIKSLLDELGFAVTLSDVYPKRPNLWAERGDGGPLIVSHADTFPQSDHSDPFHLRDLDGRLEGRGVIDAKGQIAALVRAVSLSPRPCKILITVDEEKDGKGSQLARLHTDGALVLEPTEMGIAVAQAGFLESEITVRGRSAHGSTPEAGVNAILQALDLYRQIQRLSFMKASHPLFPPPWVNLQSIKGGSSSSTVPDTCCMETDLAILPGVDLAAATEEFDRFLQRKGASHRLIDSSPPFEVEPSSKLISTLMAAFQQVTGRAPRLAGMRSRTDATNFAKRGIPTALFGAGKLSLAHSDHEELETEELETLASILTTFIDFWQT